MTRNHIAMAKKIDLTGMRFGVLVVLSREQRSDKRNSYWLCRCDCGADHSVSLCKLRAGEVRSCGCAKGKMIARAITSHGMSKSSTYAVWSGMRSRCLNAKNKLWRHYGGRGIKVCDRWESFENFIADMGPRPAGMTIERRDNDCHYEPSNCRWATRKEQCRNKRDTRFVEFDGRRMSLAEAAETSGLSLSLLDNRVRRGWPPERLFIGPLAPNERINARQR